jgi:GNAT superfamily N-acetyltransferase
MKTLVTGDIQICNDQESALVVLEMVGKQMLEKGLNPSKWWHPDNMNAEFFANYAEPEEFWVAKSNGEPIAAEILQWTQRNQDWSSVDCGSSPAALYVHWLCVDRRYAGAGLPKLLIDFAVKAARAKGVGLIRVDTNASERKLCNVYEALGFSPVKIIQESYRSTAFYQKEC